MTFSSPRPTSQNVIRRIFQALWQPERCPCCPMRLLRGRYRVLRVMTSPCPARCSRRFLEETPRNSFRVQEGAYVEANHSARKRRTVSGPCVAVRHRRVVRRRQVSRMVGDVAGCLAGPVRR